jgi:hypothetical protein
VRATEAEISKAIARFREYNEAGKHKEITQAREKHGIANSTLNGWLQNPDKARFANKARDFVAAAKELHSLKDEKKYQAYALLLKELGLKNDHAAQLAHFGGQYSLSFGGSTKDIKFVGDMTIDARSPRVVWFLARYETRGKYRVFDGLVVQRNNLLHFIGLSEYNMFVGHVRAVRDPSSEVMYGTFCYEEGSGAGYVRFAMVPSGHVMTEAERTYTDQELSAPIY